MDQEQTDSITRAFKPIIDLYVQYVRDSAQFALEQHNGNPWSHSYGNESLKPTECPDCAEWITVRADMSDWSQQIRNAYLVMVMSANRDAWKDLSTDIDHFGQDLDTVIANAAAIAIAADIADELERLS